MISWTEKKEINEKNLFEDLKDFLFEQGTYNSTDDYMGNVENLPKDIQRLIFAKIGAMMIDYANSEEF
jgi:hypothetical protein